MNYLNTLALVQFCFLLVNLIECGPLHTNKRDTLSQIVFKIHSNINSNKRNDLVNKRVDSQLLSYSSEKSFYSNLNDDKHVIELANTTTKYYLKDILNKNLSVDTSKLDLIVPPDVPSMSPAQSINTCTLKTMSITFKIDNCGKFVLNTTKCSGLCKSSEKLIANTISKKSTCAACKAIKHTFERYKIRCVDSTLRTVKIKSIRECACHKLDERINTIN